MLLGGINFCQESVVGDLPSLAAGATRWNHAPPTDMEGKDVGQLVRNWVDVVSHWSFDLDLTLW